MLTSMSPASVTLVEPAPPSPKDVLGGGSKKQLKHGGGGGRKEVLLEHIQVRVGARWAALLGPRCWRARGGARAGAECRCEQPPATTRPPLSAGGA